MVNPLIALRVDASAPARVAIGAPRQLQNTLLQIENIRQSREANVLASQVAQQKATLDASKFNLDVAEFSETQQKNIASEEEVQRKAALDRSDRMSRLLSTAIQRPELFDRIRQQAVREFPELADKIPEQFDEAFLLGAANQVESVRKQLADGVPLVEIGDPSSPTGTRFTPRSEAAGKPGKPISGLEITTNPDGTTTIRTGVRGNISGNKRDDILAAVQGTDRALELLTKIEGELQEDPGRSGIVGSVQATLQTITASLDDFARSVGLGFVADVAAGLADATIGTQFDPTLPANQVRENSLAYALARARKPTGRLNSDDVNSARKDVKLRGLTSSSDVRAKLGAIRTEFENAKRDFEKRAGQRATPNSPSGANLRFDNKGNRIQ